MIIITLFKGVWRQSPTTKDAVPYISISWLLDNVLLKFDHKKGLVWLEFSLSSNTAMGAQLHNCTLIKMVDQGCCEGESSLQKKKICCKLASKEKVRLGQKMGLCAAGNFMRLGPRGQSCFAHSRLGVGHVHRYRHNLHDVLHR